MEILAKKIDEIFNWRDKLQLENETITQYRATLLSNNPKMMNAKEIEAFSKVLNIPVKELISEYKAGRDVLTIPQIEALLEKYKV